jgi:hypothetical protein
VFDVALMPNQFCRTQNFADAVREVRTAVTSLRTNYPRAVVILSQIQKVKIFSSPTSSKALEGDTLAINTSLDTALSALQKAWLEGLRPRFQNVQLEALDAASVEDYVDWRYLEDYVSNERPASRLSAQTLRSLLALYPRTTAATQKKAESILIPCLDAVLGKNAPFAAFEESYLRWAQLSDAMLPKLVTASMDRELPAFDIVAYYSKILESPYVTSESARRPKRLVSVLQRDELYLAMGRRADGAARVGALLAAKKEDALTDAAFGFWPGDAKWQLLRSAAADEHVWLRGLQMIATEPCPRGEVDQLISIAKTSRPKRDAAMALADVQKDPEVRAKLLGLAR